MKISPEVLKQHPLPWSVRVDGRDTPRGVSVILNAEGRSVFHDALIPRDLAHLIVESVNGVEKINRVVSDYNNGTFTHYTAEKVVDNITNILRGD